jgi:hypothetical protein
MRAPTGLLEGVRRAVHEMSSRSNSASAAKMPKMSFFGVVYRYFLDD